MSIALFTGLLIGPNVCAQSQDWEIEAQKKVDSLKQKNGPGTDQALRKRLLKMRDEDQAIRHKVFNGPSDKQEQLGRSLEPIDRKLTAELKEIVRKHGWPTIRLVGLDGSQAAATILNHSPDHDFQRDWIPKLSKMVEQDQIVGSDLAPIIDKLLLADGKPQLFGSVFRFEGDFMIQEPVEDPEHVDQRRAQYLLPPMKEYIKILEDLYHKKVK